MADEEGELEYEMSEDGTRCMTGESSAVESLKEPSAQDILKGFQWGGLSMYDHLKHLLELLIATRPPNTVDYFDQFSRSIRDPRGTVKVADRLPFAQKVIRMASGILSQRPDLQEEEEMGEESFSIPRKIVSCLDTADFFLEMDVGLTRDELFRIDVALRALSNEWDEGIKEIRFWGKIFGVDRSYVVAEVTLTYHEIYKRFKDETEKIFEEGEEEEESAQDQQPVFGFGGARRYGGEEEEILYRKLNNYRLPPLPMPAKIKKEKMKTERTGEGANKKVYFVCQDPGDEWIPLPNVNPEHIVAARGVRKYLQGYLNAEVDCFPGFPGVERDLLRAMIARISAGTQISPIGFFQFGSPDEMDEGGEEPSDLVVNIDFEEMKALSPLCGELDTSEHMILDCPSYNAARIRIMASISYNWPPVPYQDLLDPAFWVHHTQHILRIGRCTYPQPTLPTGEEMMEEEQPVEKESSEKELGPPLLTPLSEDVTIQMVPPWRTKATSNLLPGSGAVGVISNLWPGAYAVCKGRRWENLYVGWGDKLTSLGYTPNRPSRPEAEYDGQDISEATDPTPEMEADWKAAHRPPSPPPFLAEEGEGEEGPLYTEPSDDL